MQESAPIKIPNFLLKKNRIENKEVLFTKFVYDQIATESSSFLIDPKIVKFSGYEVGKMNIIKVKITNNCPTPQRIHILAPTSMYFQIKYDKRGLLAYGMSEEVFISFRPNEYKYYYDTIKVHSETEKIQIPIHAYPVLNRENLREIFPRLIDFGKLEIGEEEIRKFPLTCKIPLNFEFEFSFKKSHNDIIISPLKGVIPGKSSIEIEIKYIPSEAITIDVEVDLKISQFDFEPLPIRIKATGMLSEKKNQKILLRRNSSSKKKILPPMKNLTARAESAKLPKSSNNIKDIDVDVNFLKEDKENNTFDNGALFKKSSFKIKQRKKLSEKQTLEKQFIEKSNQTGKIDKEKEIKFFVCKGDQEITLEKIESIQEIRQQYYDKKLIEIEHYAFHRYNLMIDIEYPTVEEKVPEYETKWDYYKNDKMKTRNILIKSLTSKITTMIIHKRIKKRSLIVEDFFHKCKNMAEKKQLIIKDWLIAEVKGLGQKDPINFQFELESQNIDKVQFPIQYESSNAFSNYKFEVNPRTGFDDWVAIEPINYCDSEIMRYKNFNFPASFIPHPVENSRVLRTGSEEEYFIRGKAGSNTIKFLEKDNNIEIPKIYFEPPKNIDNIKAFYNYETHKYVCVHSSLRTFIKFYECIEIDPIFNLKPKEFIYYDNFQNISYYNIVGINYIKIEMPYHFKDKLKLPCDFGFEKNIEKYCENLMEGPSKEDIFNESDSDTEEPPDIKFEKSEDLLKKIEQDDKTLLELRENNLKTLIDDIGIVREKIDNNLNIEIKKRCANLTTKTANSNKFINKHEFKLFII